MMIQGEPTCERVWRRWLAEEGCHEQPIQKWLPASARLVVVAPHPDDEFVAWGGLISAHAAQGGRVLSIAVTDGEASQRASPTFTREELAEIRRNERLTGLRHLGVSHPELLALALKDGQVRPQSDILLDRLMALLQPSDVVVSTWENDGHPDHDTAGYMVNRASAATGCTFLAAPVWMWNWAKPDDPRVPWRRMRGLSLSAEEGLRKQAALAAQSQLVSRNFCLGAVLDDAIVKRAAWPTEYYFV
ncbi:MAG TPA: PIG-L family deacetylase [Hydrogenophaga sp.]|nr:PIG-L family deacetylase [Hydrogenophaga sp.]